MTLKEAMEECRRTGRSASRGYGWIRWDEHHTYHLSAEDLVAEDWEMLGSADKSGWNRTPAQ